MFENTVASSFRSRISLSEILKIAQRHKRLCARKYVGRLLLYMTFMLVLFAVPASAGMVYGHVYCDYCKSSTGIMLYMTNKSNNERFSTTTDGNGDYSIFLPPGIYKVEAVGADNERGQPTKIRSFSNSVRQDIYLLEQMP